MFWFEEVWSVFYFYFLDVYVQILKNIYLPKRDWVIFYETAHARELLFALVRGGLAHLC